MLIITLITLFMSIFGVYIVKDWYKRIQSWETLEQMHNEYMGCLFYGWIGAMSCVIGIPMTIICFIILFLT